MALGKSTYNIYIAPHLQLQRRCSCHRQSRRIRPIGHRLSPHLRVLTCNQTAIRRPDLPLIGLTPLIHIISDTCNYMNYYSVVYPGRMVGWVGLVGWPMAPTKSDWQPIKSKPGKGSLATKYRRSEQWAAPPTKTVSQISHFETINLPILLTWITYET